jgi:hypothetical protein
MAGLVLMALINLVMTVIVWRQSQVISHYRDSIDILWAQVFGPGDLKMRQDERAASGVPSLLAPFRSLLPVPPPPVDEEPPPFHPTHLPDELAAGLEHEERNTHGATSKLTCAWWSEQDERDAELEDDYTSTLVQKIRKLSGENC